MSSSKKAKPNILFTIDIKVSGEVMSIPVYEGESHKQLIQRFCEKHIFKSDYKTAIKDKIIESLMATLKNAQISAGLKNKVVSFLGSHQQQPKSKQKSIKSSNASTPFKILANQPTMSQSQNKYVSNRHAAGGHQKIQISKPLKQVELNPGLKPQGIKKNKVNNETKIINPSQSRSSICKNQDPDLIAAYQTIYKKSKQPLMKSMAKKFLQQSVNVSLNNKSLKASKKFIANEKHQKNSPKRIQDKKSDKKVQKSSSPIKSFGNIKNSDIRSLDRYQMVELSRKSRQKSPSMPKNSSIHNNSPPKRQRIKYDIGQGNNIPKDLTYHDKYVDQQRSLLRYQNQLVRSSYRVQRASVSYDRLPYQYLENSYHRSSFQNSPSVLEPQRPISLRRTRKYKYL